jgi:trehalose-phosphatase
MDGTTLPLALEGLAQIRATIGDCRPAFFVDFDGTLAPLVSEPGLAELPPRTKEVLTALARDHLVCIASGRDLADLRRKVDLPGASYAGDHGYRVVGPPGSGIELEVGLEDLVELESAAIELERRLRGIEGVIIEAKGRSLAVHYRKVAEAERSAVAGVVNDIAKSRSGLSLTSGKLVHELRPALPWNKGRAMLWLLAQLRMGRRNACPVCIGDDLTDEDMFAAARGWGVSVIVGHPDRPTLADYLLPDCVSTTSFLGAFVTRPGQADLRRGRL